MKGIATRKSQSCWWNSHISPRNSKWLSENLQETDRLFNETLKLIEEDGDSFAQKAQMYFQRRPELVSHVEGSYRLYRALAERYDNVTSELAKNIPTEVQSQESINGSEFSTEAASLSAPSSPDRISEHKLNHLKPHSKAAGFEVFLGFGESLEHFRKGFDDSSSESGSDCDNGKVLDDFEDCNKLEARIVELESELHEVRDKLRKYKNGSEEQREHFDLENQPFDANRIFIEMVKQVEELQAGLPDHEEEIKNLRKAMGAAVKRFETEILCRDNTIKGFKTWIHAVLNKFALCNSSSEQKSSLEVEIPDKEAMAAQSSNMLLKETTELEAKFSSLMISSRSKLQLFEEKIKQLEIEKRKLSMENEKHIGDLNQCVHEFRMQVDILISERDELKAQVIDLIEDIETWDDESRKIDKQLNELQVEHDKLIQETEEARKSSMELTERVTELEDLVESQRAVVIDCAEGKKEAIRQLCFSLEHYRIGYEELRQILQVKHKGLNS